MLSFLHIRFDVYMQKGCEHMSDLQGWVCPKCNHVNSNDMKYCHDCGEPWPMADIICPNCRTVMKATNPVCPDCGEDLHEIIRKEWLLESDTDLSSMNKQYATKGLIRFFLLPVAIVLFLVFNFSVERDLPALGWASLLGFSGTVVLVVAMSVQRSVLNTKISKLLDEKYKNLECKY